MLNSEKPNQLLLINIYVFVINPITVICIHTYTYIYNLIFSNVCCTLNAVNSFLLDNVPPTQSLKQRKRGE